MGRGAGIAKGVMEDEFVEMDEFAVDPEGGAGVGEILAFEEAGADRRAIDPLVETSKSDAGVKSRLSFCI